MSPSIGFFPGIAAFLGRRTGVAAGVIVVALTASSVAHADRDKAKAYYDDAEKQYNLGKFDSAVDLYTKAYEEWPEPGFLFNIAQAYRQAGNCKQALFFYKRFLSLKASDPSKPLAGGLRAEVEARIAELEECVKREIASKPPEANMSPEGSQTTTTTPPGGTQVATAPEDDGEDDDDTAVVTANLDYKPTTVIARVAGGGSLLVVSGVEKGTAPIQFGMAITAGYPLQVAERVTLDLGASLNFMPIPVEIPDESTPEMDDKTKKIATMFGILGNVGATISLAEKIGLHLDLGVGILHLGGLSGNTVLTDGEASSVNMLGVRLAASGEYAFSPNVFGVVTLPALTFSPPGSGMNESADVVTRFDFLVGLGYRL